MLFISHEYLAFFLAVFAVHWALPWHRARIGVLLVASLIFYASWNVGLAALICASTTVDYLLARAMAALARPAGRKALCALSVTMNLGLLAYFKYVNFFLDSLRGGLTAAGHATSLPILELILPIGISFYTFEAISYTVDVYRRRTRPERSLPHLLLFILFFPHLVAGPIVRPRHFLPQIRRPKQWRWTRARLGVQLILLGLLKKMAVADRMAAFADPVFAAPAQYDTAAVWLATVAYALQIYCDFSGYSDIAIGSAHLLGYKLPRNFNLPYLAPNVAEFWHRWHISLSTWLRDYLYIPLGGSRGSEWQTCRNLLLTMGLGGLWHGANWTFVAWGLVHGGLLVVHRACRPWVASRPRLDAALRSPAGTLASTALTFAVVTVAWVFFRSPDLPSAGALLQRMVVPATGLGLPLDARGLWYTVGAVAVCHAAAYFGLGRRLVVRLPAPALGLGYAAALALALVLAPSTPRPFIYFQF
jgi:alginate O-acetyltransferase complex protein AlgI